MKIAIANDMPMATEALRRAILSGAEHQVIWSARDGMEAVRMCAQHTPDLLLMDLVMPMIDGIEATRIIMRDSPCAILIVTATPEDNSHLVFRAMGAGALDVTATPVMVGTADNGALLLAKIRTIGKLIRAENPTARRLSGAAPAAPAAAGESITTLIAIGASTGGPAALVKVLAGLRLPSSAAVVIVQHIDERFSDSFAAWLAGQIGMPVKTIDDGMQLATCGIFIAKTDDHLLLDRHRQLRYSASPRDYPYRPSVNVFLQSVADNWHHDAVGIVLTGMGRDGATGLLAMKDAGKLTIAQDRASAVYGMPRAAAELGAAKLIVAVERIGFVLQSHLDCILPPAPAGSRGNEAASPEQPAADTQASATGAP